MKTPALEKSKRNGYQSDDDTIRYKINTQYLNNVKSPKAKKDPLDDDNIRYKFPTVLNKSKPKSDTKVKPKARIKVNFWSNKTTGVRVQNIDADKTKSNRRHTVGIPHEISQSKPKQQSVKVRKRVSFLPSPLFMENQVPMVTVPDDLTIQLNEEEANDLGADLNEAFVNSNHSTNSNESNGRKSKNSVTQTSLKGTKRKRSYDNTDVGSRENELEFFSKYVVQKLRRMETNQRIYSENLINTVLMLGQLGKLNGKSKISET